MFFDFSSSKQAENKLESCVVPWNWIEMEQAETRKWQTEESTKYTVRTFKKKSQCFNSDEEKICISNPLEARYFIQMHIASK